MCRGFAKRDKDGDLERERERERGNMKDREREREMTMMRQERGITKRSLEFARGRENKLRGRERRTKREKERGC